MHAYDPNRALLVPYADLINTSDPRKRNATWGYDEATRCFRVNALSKIAVNEPVYFLNRFNHCRFYFIMGTIQILFILHIMG